MKTIKGVTIGDKFNYGRGGMSRNEYNVYEVVDFIEQKSVTTGDITGYLCIVKGINTLATNTFDIPFTTVLRNKI